MGTYRWCSILSFLIYLAFLYSGWLSICCFLFFYYICQNWYDKKHSPQLGLVSANAATVTLLLLMIIVYSATLIINALLNYRVKSTSMNVASIISIRQSIIKCIAFKNSRIKLISIYASSSASADQHNQ